MTNSLFQLRTVHPFEDTAQHLSVPENRGSVTDALYLREIANGSGYSTFINLDSAQWSELSMFAAARSMALAQLEEESDKKSSAKHMTNGQVENMQAVNRAKEFEEKVSLARQALYEAGSLRLADWHFSSAAITALEERNEVSPSGVKVGLSTIYKLTPKGKVEHRRYTGVDDE